MKLGWVILTGLAAVASAQSAANADLAGDAEVKVKRDAAAVAAAMADPLFPTHKWCWRPGQPCNSKAKREAEAIAEALADPRHVRHKWCWRPGQPCNSKAKRDALAEAEAVEDLESANDKA